MTFKEKNSKDMLVEDVVKEIETNYPEMTGEFKHGQQREYELFCVKQKDYGESNITMGGDIQEDEDNRMAIIGIVIRMNDKMQRLLNLIVKHNKQSVLNESIEDSFMDMSNYSNISLTVLAKKWAR